LSYRLDATRWRDTDPVTVIGCGGTGRFVAEGLCRLLIGTNHPIHLADFDRVEERNLERQNFYPEDLGNFKSRALAERLARKFNRPVAYSINPFLLNSNLQGRNMVIGCVDNGPARSAIAEAVGRYPWASWWIDSGNGDSWGQILIGNATRPDILERSFHSKLKICRALPAPSIQQPDILSGTPATIMSCAEAVERNEQDPLINQAMAVLVLDVVRKLMNGTCRVMQVYLNLETSALNTVAATPENVAATTGIRINRLIDEGVKNERGTKGGHNSTKRQNDRRSTNQRLRPGSDGHSRNSGGSAPPGAEPGNHG